MMKFLSNKHQNEKKPSNLLNPEQLFDKTGFTLKSSDDFWTLTSQQLEETMKQQERYVKKVKKLYQSQYEEMEVMLLKVVEFERERKKLYQDMEELQMQNESIKSQRDILERNLRDVYNHKQNTDNNILTDNDDEDLENQDEDNQELIDRLKEQCTKLTIEISHLQEDNENLTMALDTEKSHKYQLTTQKNNENTELSKQIRTLVSNNESYQHQLEFLTSEFQELHVENQALKQDLKKQDRSTQENHMIQLKDLESKLIQEKIKLDQKTRDVIRCEGQVTAQKEQLENIFNQNTLLESQSKMHEKKQQRHKAQLQEMKDKMRQSTQQIKELEINIKQIENQYEQKILGYESQILVQQNYVDEMKVKSMESINHFFDQSKLEDQIMQLIEKNNQQTILLENNQNEIQSLKDQQVKLENLITQFHQKRKFAIEEIEKLNTINQQQQQQINLLKQELKTEQQSNNGSNENIRLNTQASEVNSPALEEIKVCCQIVKMVVDVKKNMDSVIKQFITIIVENKIQLLESGLSQLLFNVESNMQKISRQIYEIIEYLEDIGVM